MADNNEIMSVAFEKDQIFGMTEREMEYRIKLFHKLVHTCFVDCIVEKRYLRDKLETSERDCIDNCVAKYRKVTNLVGELVGLGKAPK